MASNLPAATPSMTPAALLQLAVEKGADVERLAQLMELQQKWEANEARKAYVAAFAAFKGEVIKLVRDTPVVDGPLKGKKYASKFAVVNAVTEKMANHGLTSSWRVTKDEKDWLEVTCTVTHVLGHSESVSMGGPPDTGPGRNAIQARSSTNSYLEKLTLKAICGIAEQGDDDDGRGASSAPGMDEGQRADYIAAIEGAADVAELQKVFTAAYTAAKKAKDAPSMRALTEAKDAKKKALGAA